MTVTVDKFITKGLKQFSEEDLLLIYDEVLRFITIDRDRNARHSLKDLLNIDGYQEFKEIRNEITEILKNFRQISRIERVFINVKRRKNYQYH